jgi:ABC-2 type transport system ATP-binding protein
MTSPVIETHELQKVFRTFRGKTTIALDAVSLQVEASTIFGLIGQNGAGKTTLVKILLGLTPQTSGTAHLLGGPVGDHLVRRRVGYLPEQMRIPEYLKAGKFLRYMGKLNGVDSATMKRRIPELLELVGLAGVRKQVKAYSKGMQQRLGLAQALINDPEVLFLDEPTDGLDPMGRKSVRDLVTKLRAEGKTIFLNSHLLSEVEMVCDRIVILEKGRVASVATPQEFTRGTGEYLIRVAAVTDEARAAVATVIENGNDPSSNASAPIWRETTVRFKPRDRAQLNAVLDRLRIAFVEIESVEPVKLSLEEFFIKVVAGSES